MFNKEKRSMWDNIRLGGFLIVLGGYVGVLTAVLLGHFVNCMTGNTTELGISIGSVDVHGILLFFAIIVMFVFGVFLSTKSSDRYQQGHLPILFGEALALILVGTILNQSIGVVIAAFAMGLQNGLTTYITWSTGKMRTTHVTGTTTDIGVSLANKDKSETYFAVFQVTYYLAGGIFGFFLASKLGKGAFLLGGLATLLFALHDILERTFRHEVLN